jgi:hypothetical protein
MTIWMISGVLGFAGGFAVCWFFKLQIQSLVIDANTLSAKLHADADKIKGAV